MSRSIVRLGHPVLRSRAEPIDPGKLRDGELRPLFAALEKELVATAARILTAPQIGVELQVMVYRPLVDQQSDAAAASIRVVINPMLDPEHGDLVHDWESCLSIPGLRGLVPRYPKVRLRGVDAEGAPVDILAEGTAARMLQHGHDHLSGVVFLDRMRDLRSLAFEPEWREFLTTREANDSPFPADK